MPRNRQDIPKRGEPEVAGDTIQIEDTVVDSEGDLKDLSGADIVFGLAAYPGESVIVEKTITGGGVSITDAAGGVLQVTLQPSDTESLGSPDGTEYYYEIEVTDSDSITQTVTTGTITLQSDTV